MKVVSVGDVSEQVRGVSYSKTESSEEPRPGFVAILRANNITDEGLSFDDLVYVPVARVSPKQRIHANDVVIAASSGSLSVVGKAAQARQVMDGSFGAFCKVLRPNEDVDPLYFGHFFRTPAYRRIVSGLAAGANINNLRNEHLDDLQFSLPSLPEQKRIAAILDAADALRAKRRESIEQLASLIQATFLEMFGDPVTNPKGWKTVPLGDHTLKVGSGSTPTGGDAAYKQEGIALIRSQNVHDGEFRLEGLAHIDDVQAAKLANVEVQADDVLLNITGASVARVCRAPRHVLPARVNQHVCIIRAASTFDPTFVEQYLLAPSMKRRLLGIGATGATRQAITKAQVLMLDVFFAPIPLQQHFASIVECIEQQKTRLKAHLAELDTLFVSLQSRAFNGELVA